MGNRGSGIAAGNAAPRFCLSVQCPNSILGRQQAGRQATSLPPTTTTHPQHTERSVSEGTGSPVWWQCTTHSLGMFHQPHMFCLKIELVWQNTGVKNHLLAQLIAGKLGYVAGKQAQWSAAAEGRKLVPGTKEGNERTSQTHANGLGRKVCKGNLGNPYITALRNTNVSKSVGFKVYNAQKCLVQVFNGVLLSWLPLFLGKNATTNGLGGFGGSSRLAGSLHVTPFMN